MALDFQTEALARGFFSRTDSVSLFVDLMTRIQSNVKFSGTQIGRKVGLAGDFLNAAPSGAPKILHKTWIDVYNDAAANPAFNGAGFDRFGFTTPNLTMRPFILILRGGSKPFMQAGLASYGVHGGLDSLNTQRGRFQDGISGAQPTHDFNGLHGNSQFTPRFFNTMWTRRDNAYYEGRFTTTLEAANLIRWIDRARFFAEPIQFALSTDVLLASDFEASPSLYGIDRTYFQEPPNFTTLLPFPPNSLDQYLPPELLVSVNVFYYQGGGALSTKDFYWLLDDGVSQDFSGLSANTLITNKSRGDMSIGFHTNSDPQTTIQNLFIQFPNPFRDRIEAIPSDLEGEAENVSATLLYWE